MRLFFESSGQSACFLLMAPVGFLLALLLDADVIAGRLRAAADIVLLLLAGTTCLWIIVFAGESGLRAYHVLGMLTGAVLYMAGVGRLARMVRRKIRLSRQEKHGQVKNMIQSERKE